MNSMKILGFGTYDIRSHPRIKVILEGLSVQHTVRELNRPLGLGTAQRVKALQHPTAAAAFAFSLARKWGSLIVGTRAFRGKRKPDALIVGYLGHFDVILARLLYPRTRIILDHLIFASDTAVDRGLVAKGPVGKIKQSLLTFLDRMAIKAADIVLLDTDEHATLMPSRQSHKARVVPVGAPRAWFVDPEEKTGKETSSALSLVFYGLFTPLQGAPTIAKALAILEERAIDVDVTLIGEGQDANEVRCLLPKGKHVSVNWSTWVEAEKLPHVVASHDVCLGIFGTSLKAQRVVPNKAYQGIAAGCVLLTSDTPVQRRTFGEAPIYVPPGEPEALANAIESLRDPKVRESAREACLAIRARFSPDRIIRELSEEL